MTNVETKKPVEMTCTFEGLKSVQSVSGEALTAEKINSYNDFGKPEEVHPKVFSNFRTKGTVVTVILPAKSVVVLTVK